MNHLQAVESNSPSRNLRFVIPADAELKTYQATFSQIS